MSSSEDNFDPAHDVNNTTAMTVDLDKSTRNLSSLMQFRRYTLLPTARKLLRDGMEIDIGGRAFDVLLTLLSARGRIVSKDEIMRQVWPSTIVDECNLRFQMALLRRALGGDRDIVKTVPGRGYLIVEDFVLGPEARAARDNPERSPFDADAAFHAKPDHASSPASPPPPPLGLPVNQDGARNDSDPRLGELQAEITRLKLAISQLTAARLAQQLTNTNTCRRFE
jgi:DNA-binding winged helix-turn-helix (wHTH) protein